MKFLAIACLLSATSAISLNDPNWGPHVNSLEHCPDFDERFTLKDGKTKAVPYPDVGFNCNKQYQLAAQDKNATANVTANATNLADQKAKTKDIASDIAVLEHCPDFDERFTLKNGRDLAVPYPQKGYNCNPEYALHQKK